MMDKQRFTEEFQNYVGVPLTADLYLFRYPLRLVDTRTAKPTFFASLEGAFAAIVEGRSVWDYICDRYPKRIEFVMNGGGGGSSGMGTFSFGHAGGGGDGGGPSHVPAEANVRIKTKTEAGAMEEFSQRFANADHEWAYTIDEQGYVHGFAEGGRSSVMPEGRLQGHLILHNHPSGGAFSDSDLISMSMSGARGVVAHTTNGDWVVRTTGHFKPEAFVRAVRSAKMKGTDYDDAVRRWLSSKDRQQKFGYRFQYVKESEKNYVARDNARQATRGRNQGTQLTVGGKQYRVTGTQESMTGGRTVVSAQVYRGGKWQEVNVTPSLSRRLTQRLNSRF